MKKLDAVIIGLILVIALTSMGTYKYLNRNNNEKTIVISVDGKPYRSIPIDDQYNEEIIIEKEGRMNVIHIENGGVVMDEANCPDEVCIRTGFISEPGQMIVCLPHKVVVEVVGEVKKDGIDVMSN